MIVKVGHATDKSLSYLQPSYEYGENKRLHPRRRKHHNPIHPFAHSITSLATALHVRTFQPVSSRSSAFSSSVGTRLYRMMSRCRLRMRIMAIIAVRNSTISSEFTMENQCTCITRGEKRWRRQDHGIVRCHPAGPRDTRKMPAGTLVPRHACGFAFICMH